MQSDTFKTNFLKTAWRILTILLGSCATAFSITFLIGPHKLLTGGVTGISLLLSYFTPIDTGIWVIAINIPLFIIAWRKIDIHFALYSIIGTGSLAVAIYLFGNFLPPREIVADPILACIFGGALSGFGTGLAVRSRGSHGGTDIIAVLVRQKLSVGVGMVTFYMNVVMVTVLAFFYGIELALLSVFAQYITANTLDRVVTGLNTAKAVMIVSDKADEIGKYIMERMYRGVTFLDGEGGYGGKDKKIIWCVVTTSQLSRIKGAMKAIDPNAFMAINDTSEIIGKGFYRSPF